MRKGMAVPARLDGEPFEFERRKHCRRLKNFHSRKHSHHHENRHLPKLFPVNMPETGQNNQQAVKLIKNRQTPRGLISAQQRSSDLEDYFLSLIGGRHATGKEGF